MMPLWKGAAAPMSPGAMQRAADALGCELAVIKAVWETESSGRPFRRDGSLERRFEPHKMPRAKTSWRDSLAIGWGQREKLFAAAYKAGPETAMDATSWGGPQIMGFNAEGAGFANAQHMVEAMADSEDMQLEAFVQLIRTWRLQQSLVSRDWRTLARGWNGPGKVDDYAPKLEAAYRRHSGQVSAQVLRMGDTGPAVKQLQKAVGVKVDGSFGRMTHDAVLEFQERAGLHVDGVVGARTWAELEAARDAQPMAQPTRVDDVVRKVRDVGAVAGTVGSAAVAIEEVLPAGAYDLLAYGAVLLGLGAVAVFVYQRMVRRT